MAVAFLRTPAVPAFTVRAKLVLLVTLLLGAIAAFILLYLPGHLQSMIRRSAEAEAVALAQMAAFSVQPALLFGDPQSAAEALGGVQQNSRVAYVVVTGADGQVFAAVNLAAAERADYLQRSAPPDGASVQATSLPIRHAGGRIGTLHLGLSLAGMHELVARTRAAIAGVSVLVFLAGLAVTLAIGTYLTRPLSQVAAAAGDIARGDWSRRAPVTSRDELGELASTFNLMLDRLDGSRRDLERRTLDLEEEVAQRQRSEAKLQSSNELFALAAAAVDGVIYDWDVRSERLRWTDGLQRVFGYDPDETNGAFDWWEERIHPQDRARILKQIEAGLAAGGDFAAEYRFRTKSGGYLHVRDRGRFLVNGDGRPSRMVGIMENATAVKRLEEQFLQAQKLEGLGRLAGGVAHDFNNLLTGILGYGDLLLATLPQGSPGRPHVEEIRKAGQRAAGLTRQLLAFSRKQVVEPRVVEVNGAVADLEKMLRRMIGEDVELETDLRPDAGRVLADPGQLDQVLLNIAVNARDAMPDGGRLTLRTGRRLLLAVDPRSGAPAGRYATITLTDTGCGMDEATRARIFEPFFTTKGLGQGTGLGMATVYGIVQGAHGHIWVDSEPGAGATVGLLFPQVEAASAPAPAPEAPLAQPPPPHATILLVEDEESVRSLVRTLLSARGYRVLEADRPAAALDLERSGAEFDLLLTDVVMPDMSGRELADRLLARHPGLPVVFMSGYLDDVILRHGLSEGEVLLLQKPFTARALLEKLGQALGADAESSAALA